MKQAVTSRDIKLLWHFTRRENLDGILRDGIIPRQQLELNMPDIVLDFDGTFRDDITPRQQLETNRSDIIFNDNYRHDNCLNANCISITFPNYKMFYALRQKNPGVEWVILALPPKILWQKDCAFCIDNAASSNVTGTPIRERKTVAAFHSIFDEYAGKASREKMQLKNEEPTNPQAEILVFDIISPADIIAVVCEKKVLEMSCATNFQR